MRYLLVLLCACRFSWSTFKGAPPRASNNFKLALYADPTAMTMARGQLQQDPHITLVDVDVSAIAKDPQCTSETCAPATAAACAWAAPQGIEYYAVASVTAAFASHFECTHYSGSILDKHEECDKGVVTNEHTNATYMLTVYDAKTCEPVPALSQRISAMAAGPEDSSKAEALANLAQMVPAKSQGMPDQVTIGADGRVAGDASDGYYAVFRLGNYRGYARVRGAGTPGEEIRPMYFPLSPEPGDALVRRGRRKFLDLALDGAIGSLTFDGERRIAGGLGAHVRHYKLDGGFQFGFGIDYVASLATKSNAFVVMPEVGWGVPIAPGFVVSANVSGGWVQANQVIAATDAVVRGYTGQISASARVQTFLTTWFYVTADVGYVLTGTVESFDGNGAGDAHPMSIRSPLARLYAGFDI